MADLGLVLPFCLDIFSASCYFVLVTSVTLTKRGLMNHKEVNHGALLKGEIAFICPVLVGMSPTALTAWGPC